MHQERFYGSEINITAISFSNSYDQYSLKGNAHNGYRKYWS